MGKSAGHELGRNRQGYASFPSFVLESFKIRSKYRGSRQRQLNGHCGPASWRAFDTDGALMRLHKPLRGREAQTSPAGLGRKEGCEDPVSDVGRDTGTRCGNVDVEDGVALVAHRIELT